MRIGKKGKTIIFISVALAIVLAVAYCIFFVFLPAKKQKEQRLLVEQYYQNKFALYAQENEQYADTAVCRFVLRIIFCKVVSVRE